MNKQRVQFDVKTDDEAGSFSAYVSTWDLDLGGDRVMPGAFKADLASRGPRRPVLWAHDTTEPVGYIDLQEDARGLFGKGQLLLDVQRARELRSLMAAKVVAKMSMGYETVDQAFVKNERRLITVKVHEASAVVFPMNPHADIVESKDADDLMSVYNSLVAANARLRADEAQFGGFGELKAQLEAETALDGFRDLKSRISSFDALRKQLLG